MLDQHFSETTGPQRLTYGLLAGCAVAALPVAAAWPLRGLLGWSVGVMVYLGLAWRLCAVFDAKRTRERAQAQDEPSLVVLFVLLLATLVGVAAITALMQASADLTGVERVLHIGLSMLALALSWLFIQTIFAFHYAHRYYQPDARHAPRDDIQPDAQASAGQQPASPGLLFPGGLQPDYFDFLYYAHVVGMTSQVSDVQVASRAMRRLTLGHSVLAFGFNMLVLALSINVVAGLLR